MKKSKVVNRYTSQSSNNHVVPLRQMVPESHDLAHSRQNTTKLPHFQTAIFRNFEGVILVLGNHKVEQPFLNLGNQFMFRSLNQFYHPVSLTHNTKY